MTSTPNPTAHENRMSDMAEAADAVLVMLTQHYAGMHPVAIAGALLMAASDLIIATPLAPGEAVNTAQILTEHMVKRVAKRTSTPTNN